MKTRWVAYVENALVTEGVLEHPRDYSASEILNAIDISLELWGYEVFATHVELLKEEDHVWIS